jgi:hypothetical protein
LTKNVLYRDQFWEDLLKATNRHGFDERMSGRI